MAASSPCLLKHRGLVAPVPALARRGHPGPEKGQDLLEISDLTITFPSSVMSLKKLWLDLTPTACVPGC